jgi:hypothetical protein
VPEPTWRRSAARSFLAAVLALALAVTAPDAQGMIRLSGVVQWVTATRMQMITDDGGSVNIDLSRADQASYQALRNGDRVIVDGVLASDRRHVVASEIWRDSGRGYWTQSP